MSRHFVTLRFLPGEYRDFDAKDGVFECLVDVHSVVAQLEDSGQVPSMESYEEMEEKLEDAEIANERILDALRKIIDVENK